ncbi:hypothetical protein PAMP_019861 [Pampus punctatissimus]
MNVTTNDRWTKTESVSFHPDYSHILNDTNIDNVTDKSIQLLTAHLSPDLSKNSDVSNVSRNIMDTSMKSELVSPRPDYSDDILTEMNTKNVTEASVNILTVLPTPYPAHDTRNVSNITDTEKLPDTNLETESASFHKDFSHDTLNDTNTVNITEATIQLLSGPISADEISDAFNGSKAIIGPLIKNDSSYTPHLNVTSNERWTRTESPKPHLVYDNTDTLNVTVTEKLSYTSIGSESTSFHPDYSHNILNNNITENITGATVKLFTDPLSTDSNQKSDAFNNSGNIIDTTMKSDSSYLLQTNNDMNVTTDERWTETDYFIETIKCSEEVTKMQSTFGAWMSDASQLNEGRYWQAEHFSGRRLTEYRNISAFQNTSIKTIDVQRFYQGCGHVVYKGFFYFHNAGTYKLVKFDLNTRRTNTLIMAHSRYNNLTYLFRNSKTYFKFAVDENGLWVIFALNTGDNTMVAKLNPETFSVESVINTAYPTRKAGNAFIACGVLYITDFKDRRVTYAFDLKKVSPLDASFDLRPANGILSMLSYYPNKKLLYMWDNSSVKTCKVKLEKTQT